MIAARGYSPVYHEHEINHCPGCGRTHWLIGRLTAECAFCATAILLADGATDHRPLILKRGRGGGRVR